MMVLQFKTPARLREADRLGPLAGFIELRTQALGIGRRLRADVLTANVRRRATFSRAAVLEEGDAACTVGGTAGEDQRGQVLPSHLGGQRSQVRRGHVAYDRHLRGAVDREVGRT